MTTNQKRTRRTPEERTAALQAELDRLTGMKKEALKRTMKVAGSQLLAIADTQQEIGTLREECKALAARLNGWV